MSAVLLRPVGIGSFLLFLLLLIAGTGSTRRRTTTDALSNAIPSTASPKGSAAKPFEKKNIAVLGGGGYLGAVTFGFLQRAASLYGTGIGSCRCLGATADTAVRLNVVLGKHFCLAQADESLIKLTDLSSAEAIQNRLEGIDALILGSDLFLQKRPVTGGTYERTPNDKAWEVYWDFPKGSFTTDTASSSPGDVKASILQNVLTAAKQADVKHLVVVDHGGSMLPQLEASGIQYTCIIPCTSSPPLTDTPNYSFKEGVVSDLSVTAWVESSIGGEGPTSVAEQQLPVCREDLAALCVQSLQSLSWEKSRRLSVSCNGPVKVPVALLPSPPKRVDQQWCVNGFLLADKLKDIA